MSTAEDGSSQSSRTAVQQAPGLWRTDLQRQDLSVPGREAVQSRVDIGPEAPLVKHTHPGEEIIYILEGSLEYQIEGQPPMTFSAGEALTVPAGVVHAVRNVGSGNAAELATYVVEKGKPLLTLAE
jgi:quercetin dioxygenase-like cupin family protein